EFADNGASARAEGLVTFLNDAPGRRPIAGRRIGKERSIAIVIVQPVQAKEPGLEPVIALDHMVMPFRRRHQGLDDRVADCVLTGVLIGIVRRGYGLVEKGNKRGPASQRFLVKYHLLVFTEIMGPTGTFLFEVVAILSQKR